MAKAVYLKRVVFGLVIVIALAIAILYLWSALILKKKYDVPLTKMYIPTDTASIREGNRLIYIEHCRDCHGEKLTGRVFDKIKNTAKLVGPNLTSIIDTYSNAELERVIRHGVKKNGTSVFFMPSNMYYELKDESVAKIIAYLRMLRPLPSPPGVPASITYYPLGRLQLLKGKFPPRAATINHTAPRQYAKHDTSQISFGRYLTITVCSNCHGKDLKGDVVRKRPNLVIAAAYTEEQFRHLIKTGEGGLGRKDLGQMSELAKNHFSYLNESEIDAMYAFLKTLPFRKD